MAINDPKDPEKITRMSADRELRALARELFVRSAEYNYSYNFSWLGRPIIQYPEDVLAMQEIIWRIQPDLIIETGIAHGGSLIFYASMLELLGGDRHVLGVDIDIREHNRVEIEKHPMFKRITMLQGSSIDEDMARRVRDFARDKQQVLLVLDSNHTHDHVLRELELYAPLVTKGSYVVVFDTVVEDMREDAFPNRPWGKGNNPKTAVWEYLKRTDRFEIDREIDDKLLLSVAPNGYLRCVNE